MQEWTQTSADPDFKQRSESTDKAGRLSTICHLPLVICFAGGQMTSDK